MAIESRTDKPSDPRSSSGAGGAAPEFTQELRERLSAADPEALARFYEVYFDRVYGYVKRMLGEDHTAEDVTQDIFLHIQRSVKSYDPARELDPWVFTIATNKVRDHWRSRQHRDGLRETSLDDSEAAVQPVAAKRGPMPAIEREELRGILDRAIGELPEAMRSTLVLRFFEGLSFESIAESIDRNEAAARKRYSRALSELRRILEQRLGEQPQGGSA